MVAPYAILNMALEATAVGNWIVNEFWQVLSEPKSRIQTDELPLLAL